MPLTAANPELSAPVSPPPRQIPRPPLPFGITAASHASAAQNAVQARIQAAMAHEAPADATPPAGP